MLQLQLAPLASCKQECLFEQPARLRSHLLQQMCISVGCISLSWPYFTLNCETTEQQRTKSQFDLLPCPCTMLPAFIKRILFSIEFYPRRLLIIRPRRPPLKQTGLTGHFLTLCSANSVDGSA